MNALFLAEYSKRWGIVAFVYAGIILLSSVYLGWHYAIDGYASIIVVTACHFALRWLMSPDEKDLLPGTVPA